MPDDILDFYKDIEGLERYLNLPKGGLRNIPIYALVPAVEAIAKVQRMEKKSQFRPGLYYIVLADLRANTQFTQKYGNAEGEIRVEWFHTTIVQTIGELDMKNYIAFSKTIGDASLLIFSSFADVFAWSQKLTANLAAMSEEYPESLDIREVDIDTNIRDQLIADFGLRARRLVHLGEVGYKDSLDPLSLAVSQTFKIEKAFQTDELGCTQAVYQAAYPLAKELGVRFIPNETEVVLAGDERPTPTYYVSKSVAS